MPPGRNPGGSSSGGGRGGAHRGRGRGGGSRSRGRGRGGRSSGRGTALPSSFTGRGGGGGRGGAKGDDRRRRGGGGQNAAGYEFDDGGEGVSDRHKYDDEAGDSDDGPGPEDSDFEDEEVDEDAAFDSADEARYGEIMDTILERRSGKQGGGGDDDDDMSDDESDDGEGGGGGMSVMDMLAANEAAEEAAENGKGKGKGKARARASDGAGEGGSSRTAPASEVSSANSALGDDDDDDEGGFEGGDAMDEDVDDAGGASEEEEDDDEEEGDEEERHAQLMGFVGALGEQAAAAHRAAEDRRSSQLLKEGEFNATGVVDAAGGGVAAGGKKGAVTMETLMGSLQNSKGFAAVKKQVAALSGKSGTPSAPVSKTAELRAERETAYDSRKSDMRKWVAPVQANRKAETLDFTPSTKTNLSNAALASKMEPTTDMEKEVEMLLTAGGASEAGLAEKEMEELKSKAYTKEEVRERQAELSKMRALMLYKERKQHHMNKIKSKVYRKIKKRQRDRAGDGQPEDDGELEEKAARKRAEERMSLRHKNTTKWVKNALRAKGGAGKDDRKAIAEQLKIGQELRAKMDGVDNDSSADDSSSSEEEEGENNTGKSRKRKPALRDADRDELEGIGGEDGDEEAIAAGGKGAALFKMAFMKKAMDRQREQAREEASVVLRELEEASAAAEDGSSFSFEDDTRSGGRDEGKNREGRAGGGASWRGGGDTAKEARDKAAAEVAKALPAGALQSTAVSMDARVRSAVASAITIDLGGGGGGGGLVSSAGVGMGAEGGKTQSLNRSGDGAEAEGMASAAADSSEPDKSGHAGTGDANGREERKEAFSEDGGEGAEEEEEGEDKSNPWLAPTPRRSKERRGRTSNGEVLLDVRKAAVTALSAFGGAPDEGDGESTANGHGGAAGIVVRAGDAADGVPGLKTGGKSQAGKKKSGGRNKRRKQQQQQQQRGGGGGDGGGGGHKDASDGNDDEGSEKKAKGTETTARGDERAKGNKKESDGPEESVKNGGNGDKSAKRSKDKKQKRKKKRKSDGSEGVSGGNGNKRAKTAKGGVVDANGDSRGGGAPPASTKAKLAGLSNDELVRRAFAAPDFDSEFKETKDAEVEKVLAKGREKLPGSVTGWGSWAGDGAPKKRSVTRHQKLAKKVQEEKEELMRKSRKDDRLPKVVLNEKRQKRSAKYMVSEVPYPFTSREQYERSLRQPIGGEWNTSQSVRAMTRPAVVVRAGVAVAPMKLGKLHRDNAKDKKSEVPPPAEGGKKGGEGKPTRGGARRSRRSTGGR